MVFNGFASLSLHEAVSRMVPCILGSTKPAPVQTGARVPQVPLAGARHLQPLATDGRDISILVPSHTLTTLAADVRPRFAFGSLGLHEPVGMIAIPKELACSLPWRTPSTAHAGLVEMLEPELA